MSNFKTEIKVDGEVQYLSNFIQDVFANWILGTMRTLECLRQEPTIIEIRIEKLGESVATRVEENTIRKKVK